MSRLVLSILTISLAANAAEPDQWKGLKLDSSTQAEAVAALGDPTDSGRDQKLHTPVDALLDKKLRFDKLVFKKGQGFDRAELFFYGGRLKAIYINLRQEIKAASLSEAYQIEFEPKASVIERGSGRREYERHKGKVYPVNFPPVYELIGQTENSWVAAYVGNASIGAVLRQGMGVADDSMGFPGKVGGIWLISKSLRDAAGIEALK